MSKEEAMAFLFIWLIHASVAVAISFPIVLLGRHRVEWRGWDLLAFAVPFCVWLVFWLYGHKTNKGISNILGEPLLLSLAMPLAAFFRICIGRVFKAPHTVAALIALLCIGAALIYFYAPDMGGSLG